MIEITPLGLGVMIYIYRTSYNNRLVVVYFFLDYFKFTYENTIIVHSHLGIVHIVKEEL